MSRYQVELSVAEQYVVLVEVEADNEEQAEEIAVEEFDPNADIVKWKDLIGRETTVGGETKKVD